MFKKLLLSLVVLISLSLPAYAAVGIPSEYYPEGLPTITGEKPADKAAPKKVEEARDILVSRIINVFLAVAGVVAILFIINNAWYLIISGGKEETITQHKKGLMWAIVGLIAIILSFSIIRFVITVPFTADEAAKPADQTQTK